MSGWMSGACTDGLASRPELGDCEGPLTVRASRASQYLALGWVVALLGRRVWLMAGHPYDALTVPGRAGRHVLHILHKDGVVGPVAFWPGEDFRCVFFAQPDGHDLTVVREPLSGVPVTYARAGEQIELPAHGRGPLNPRWLVPPSRTAPSASTVMATALSVLLGDRRHDDHMVHEPSWHGM